MRYTLPTNEGIFGMPFARQWDPTHGLTEDARRIFSRGHCHAFACALAEATGWAIYVIVDKASKAKDVRYAMVGPFEDGDIEERDAWAHAVVRTPSGDYVDINGPDALNRYKALPGWEGGIRTLGPVTPAALREICATPGYEDGLHGTHPLTRTNLGAGKAAARLLLPTLPEQPPVTARGVRKHA